MENYGWTWASEEGFSKFYIGRLDTDYEIKHRGCFEWFFESYQMRPGVPIQTSHVDPTFIVLCTATKDFWEYLMYVVREMSPVRASFERLGDHTWDKKPLYCDYPPFWELLLEKRVAGVHPYLATRTCKDLQEKYKTRCIEFTRDLFK